MRSGPTDRGGFTPLANAEAERLFNELTPEQFRLYVGLRIEAQYGEPCERRDAFGRPVLLEPGEVLFGIDAAAVRYGLSRDQVRRAVERFEALALVSRRAGVAPATPPGLGTATPRGREAATPPTVLTFLTDRETCWRAKRPATPPAAAAATPPGRAAAPIQHRTHEPDPSSLRSEGGRRAADDDRPPPRQLEVLDLTIGKPPLPDPGPSPFERVVGCWFDAWQRAGRGKHSPLTEAEGATVKRLVRALGADELVARIERAFRDPWFLEHGDLMLFAKQREKFATPGRAAPIARAPAPLRDPGCAEWGQLRAALRERVRPEPFAKFFADLVGRMDGSALVLVAPDEYRREFLLDNHREFFARVAGELGIAGDVRIEAASRALAAAGAAP